MKKIMGALIFLLLSGMTLGTIQPALVFAGSTGGGNIWDQFVYTQPFTGTRLHGPLSIYYEYNFVAGDFVYCGTEGESYMVTMYYTVRLKKQKDPTLWVFEGSSQRSRSCGICLTDLVGQGEEINNFLNDIVLGNLAATPPIFPNGVKEWHLTAINNGHFYDRGFPPSRAFIADIEVTVKPK
jgi:hypothetical protein